jgi:hypothetical protein
MAIKKCFKCGIEKDLSQFYPHPKMKDGRLNKCIDCTKNDSKLTELKLRSTPEGIEKDRARGREKYHRLNYREKYFKPSTRIKPIPLTKRELSLKYKMKYPEKINASCNSSHIKVPDGMQKHHWSYNTEHYKDVLFLSIKDHNTAHRFMIYDQERMMYRKLEGELLDTKEKHLEYISLYIN